MQVQRRAYGTQMRFQFYGFQVRTLAELFDFFPIIHQL